MIFPGGRLYFRCPAGLWLLRPRPVVARAAFGAGGHPGATGQAHPHAEEDQATAVTRRGCRDGTRNMAFNGMSPATIVVDKMGG